MQIHSVPACESGAETFSWFDRTAQIVGEFADVTSIGILTKDPGSVESVLTWAHHLGDRVRYLIVLNELLRGTGFDAWTDTPEVKALLRPLNLRSSASRTGILISRTCSEPTG
jgi:hypothetical protein